VPKVFWGSSVEINPDGKYLAMNVDMERKHAWSFFSFLRQAQTMIPELRESKGIIGYSGNAEMIFGKKARFFSVWESERDLYRFAQSQSHSKAMVKFKPAASHFKLVKWEISGSDIPKKWKGALEVIPSSMVPQE